jgi:Bacterial Ig-like domain (group 1)
MSLPIDEAATAVPPVPESTAAIPGPDRAVRLSRAPGRGPAPRRPRPHLEHLLIAGGILIIAVAILGPQLSSSSGRGPTVSPSAAAVGEVTSASPAAPSQGPSPTDEASLSPSIGPSEPSLTPLTPAGTAVPPPATTAPILVPPAPTRVPTAVPKPIPTHRPTPTPTPAPAGAAAIHLSGGLVDLSSGASAHALTVTVKDASNRPVPGQAVVFSHAAGTGTVSGLGSVATDGAGVAKAELVGEKAGPITLEIQAGSVSAAVSFDVVAGALNHVILTPGVAEIAPGGSQAFTTIAYDAAGNVIGDVSSAAVLTITRGGTCTASSCTAAKPGPHTVTSVYAGSINRAFLVVHGKGGDDQ